MKGTTGNQKVDSTLSSMKFLWDSAGLLQTYSDDNRHLGIIMHHFRERCMVLSRNQVIDSSSVFKKTEVCTSCGNYFSDGKYKLKILPHKQKMKLLKQKLIQKPEEMKSKYNKYLSSFFSKRKDNVLVKQCKVCKKVSKLGLTKPILKAEEDASVMTPNENLLTEIKGKRKRKKSKKDRFSGLDPSAVASARLSRGWRDSLHSPSYTDETSSACFKEDSDVYSDPSNNSLIETIKLKKHNLLDDNSNTSLEWNGNTSFLSDKSFINEREQCNNVSKKIKKQKSSIISNSFINFNNSVSNEEINLKSPEHFSPQLNNSVTSLKQNHIDSKKSSIGQVSTKRNKINKKVKKKKKSDLSNFLSQL